MLHSDRQFLKESAPRLTPPREQLPLEAEIPLRCSIISLCNCNTVTSEVCDTKLTLDWIPNHNPRWVHKLSSPRSVSRVSQRELLQTWKCSSLRDLRKFVPPDFTTNVFFVCVFVVLFRSDFFFSKDSKTVELNSMWKKIAKAISCDITGMIYLYLVSW